jgi:hypothetical protein
MKDLFFVPTDIRKTANGSGMHGWTALSFYDIHTPLTEAVLPDSENYKTIVSWCYQLL